MIKRSVTLGLSLLAGAALVETALVPGLVIGGAAVLLAPSVLPALRRRLRPLFGADADKRTAAATPQNEVRATPQADAAPTFAVKQAIAKTITFRIIVTTLDFTSNYVVIGELATAAGLSSFNLIAGPLFYFGHEAAWNYLRPSSGGVDLAALARGDAAAQAGGRFTVSRALAKTITFRTIATVVDFTANYVVVRDLATAAGLSAFGFVLGPFVYLGHEKAWDYFTTRRVPDDAAVPTALLPAPT